VSLSRQHLDDIQVNTTMNLFSFLLNYTDVTNFISEFIQSQSGHGINNKILTATKQKSKELFCLRSFPDGINFDKKKKFGAIPENTILTITTRNGRILNQWGNNTSVVVVDVFFFYFHTYLFLDSICLMVFPLTPKEITG